MSMMLMVKALSVQVGNPLRKLVLIKLADQANDKGECWPSYQTIADACEISRRSVILHIQWLEEHGFLKIEKRIQGEKNNSNLFHLTIDNGWCKSCTGANPAPPSEPPAPSNGESPAPPSESPAPKPVNETINKPFNETGDSAHSRKDVPPLVEPTPSPAKFDFFSALIEAGAEQQAAADFMAVRKAKKAVNSQTAFDGFCREVQKAGISVNEAVRLCAEQNWKGFTAQWYSNHQNSGANHASNSTDNRKLTPLERVQRAQAETRIQDGRATAADYQFLGLPVPPAFCSDDGSIVAVVDHELG